MSNRSSSRRRTRNDRVIQAKISFHGNKVTGDRQTDKRTKGAAAPLTYNKGTKEWNSMYKRKRRKTVCGMLIHGNGIN